MERGIGTRQNRAATNSFFAFLLPNFPLFQAMNNRLYHRLLLDRMRGCHREGLYPQTSTTQVSMNRHSRLQHKYYICTMTLQDVRVRRMQRHWIHEEDHGVTPSRVKFTFSSLRNPCQVQAKNRQVMVPRASFADLQMGLNSDHSLQIYVRTCSMF